MRQQTTYSQVDSSPLDTKGHNQTLQLRRQQSTIQSSQSGTPRSSLQPCSASGRVQTTYSPSPSINQPVRFPTSLQSSGKPSQQSRQYQFGGASTSGFYGVKSKMSPLFDWKGIQKRKSKSKKKKIPTWSHTFVCLSSTSQEVIPDGQERALLQIAGLGEKRITMSAYSDAQDICFELNEQYPKLSGGGGFELLRVPEGGGKMLDVIASPEAGYTVSYLKAVIHHAKIYVRPLQQDLSLDPIEQEVSSQIL